MRFKISIFIVFAILFNISPLFTQDTTWVQAFKYGSKTRDSLIVFPSGDHNQYEKILMYYNMRCKSGLISSGAERNKGCGEWDYSCNTNIIDSSGVDSLKAIHPNYIINGYTEDFFPYTSKPTYTYTDYSNQNIVVNSNAGITRNQAGNHAGDVVFVSDGQDRYKAWFIYKGNDLKGLSSGNITGLNFKNKGVGTLSFLKIKIATTNETNLTNTLIQSLNFSEVVNRQVDFTGTDNTDVFFHKVHSFNGTSNIVLELSFTGKKENIANLELIGSKVTDFDGMAAVQTDSYLELGDQGAGTLAVSGMKDIKNEITVAFWSNGNEAVLPANNSIFHAEDNNNFRQLNVHLPWSNSRIFWDCGSDANGVYDRIDKATNPSEFEGVWNHWTFTKNTITGSMKIYLNGLLWHSATSKFKPINIQKFTLGSGPNSANPYFGKMDDFSVWSKELTADEIKLIMYQNPTTSSVLNQQLVAYYDMNENDENKITDKSIHGGTTVFGNKISRYSWRGSETFKSFSPVNYKPDISWIKGTINMQVVNLFVRDSIVNAPYKVQPYSIVNKKLAAGSPAFYWLAGVQYIYDEDGVIISEIEIPEEDIIIIDDLVYYNYSPSKYELLSFVTPYGIGLDFGQKGKTWIFDVTDYGPVLKNKKRFLMDKGGEWQEEMNIRFAFIKGKPSRPVLSIQQVWPAAEYGYTSILNNRHLESRQLNVETEVKSLKVRTVATGHGQEGEFIQRTHSLNINGGNNEYAWQLWKECANNPVYPQGGTWVYDRAGWCPGAPSDLREFEIMPFINGGSSFTIDYGLNTASGDSRYIVNTQLVKYGETTFNIDAKMEEIISPSENIIYQRSNPVCTNAMIMIMNNGKTPLTSVSLKYGIEGGVSSTYNWTGNLNYLGTQKITLPNLPIDAFYNGKAFFVTIEKANNLIDEYQQNNSLTSKILPVTQLDEGIIVSLKTNGLPNETKWTLKDGDGNVIKSSRAGMGAYVVYNDTIKNLSGCYQLQFTDSDQDGISWWANGDGDGYIRAKGINGGWITFQPDFGSELTFNFVAGIKSGTADEEEDISKVVNIFPNPTTGESRIELTGFAGATKIDVLNHVGSLVYSEHVSHRLKEKHVAFLDLAEKTPGIYFVRITNKSLTHSYKLIKI